MTQESERTNKKQGVAVSTDGKDKGEYRSHGNIGPTHLNPTTENSTTAATKKGRQRTNTRIEGVSLCKQPLDHTLYSLEHTDNQLKGTTEGMALILTLGTDEKITIMVKDERV